MAVYVKDNIFAKRRVDLEPTTVECVWLELFMGGQSYLYGTFYRPPNSPASIWSDIEYSIDLAFNTKISKIIITGDFDANLLTNNYQSEYLINIMNMYNMTQLIEEPNHFTEETCTLLDVIIVSDSNILEKAYVGDCFLDQNVRYHCPVYASLTLCNQTSHSFKREIWLFNQGDYVSYRNSLNSID